MEYYVPGPVTASEWSRFKHYARFVRYLHYPARTIVEPSVFMFLQQHGHGAPLFPNIHELVWEHATPELAVVVSPSIRVLRLPEDTCEAEVGAQDGECAYSMRRHAFTRLLPSVLEGLPNLKELELRTLGHETFWLDHSVKDRGLLSCQKLHTLRVIEPHRCLRGPFSTRPTRFVLLHFNFLLYFLHPKPLARHTRSLE